MEKIIIDDVLQVSTSGVPETFVCHGQNGFMLELAHYVNVLPDGLRVFVVAPISEATRVSLLTGGIDARTAFDDADGILFWEVDEFDVLKKSWIPKLGEFERCLPKYTI